MSKQPDNRDTYYSPRLEDEYESYRDTRRKFNSVTMNPMVTQSLAFAQKLKDGLPKLT